MKISRKIGEFKLYQAKGKTIKGGHLYIKEMFFDVPNKWQKRKIFVYLPSTYEFENPNKRFKVLYMMDGHNLFDEEMSSFGEWHVDEHIEKRIKDGREEFICVGVDCPDDEVDRLIEMSIPSEPETMSKYYHDNNGVGYGDLLADFITLQVRPLINKLFFTKTNKEDTAIGGASMGGMMAFYIAMRYKDIYGFQLDYSPAFLVYKDEYFLKRIEDLKIDYDEFPKCFMYVGDKEWEEKAISNLTIKTYEILKNKGLDDKKLRFVFDSYMAHFEYGWDMYFPFAMSYWLDEEHPKIWF